MRVRVRRRPLLIGIGGGSGSGKSWLARYLRRGLGSRAAVVCQDWYYRDNGHLSPRQARRLNFDHPSAIETPLFLRQLRELMAGRPVWAPRYDYARHARLGYDRRVRPAQVLILDGLFVLEESKVQRLLDLRVYIDVPADERLLRRIRRDVEHRRVDLEETLRLYEHCVRPMHECHVAPGERRATHVWRQMEDRGFPPRLLRLVRRRAGAA